MGNPGRVSIVNPELKAATGRSAGSPSSATRAPPFQRLGNYGLLLKASTRYGFILQIPDCMPR